MRVKGRFEVELKPATAYGAGADGNTLARMTLDKTFYGALDATSKGEMLSVMTATDGSAGYVVIEQVQGSLEEKTGGFVLQHFGIMDKGKDRLVLEVVPDSGSGELAGITGSMGINIIDGEHHYDFDYSLVK